MESKNGLSRSKIEKLVENHGFYESAFHMIPSLFSGEWQLLKENDQKYYSRLSSDSVKRPLTTLEKAWLKALIDDPRINLFVNEVELEKLKTTLADVEPLFSYSDFHYYDRHSDGDDFSHPEYIKTFKTLLTACQNNAQVIIEYDNGKGS